MLSPRSITTSIRVPLLVGCGSALGIAPEEAGKDRHPQGDRNGRAGIVAMGVTR